MRGHGPVGPWFLIALSLSLVLATECGARPPSLPSGSARELSKALHARGAALRPPRLKLAQQSALRGRRPPERIQILVIGCDFSDSLMWGRDLDQFPGWPPQRRDGTRIPGTDIYQFSAHDSTYFDIQMLKVADYFETVSFGRFSMEWSVRGPIENVSRPMAYYGSPDSSSLRLAALAQELVDRVDAEVDFGRFDTLVLIHAGAGKETDILGDSPEQIFSNYLDARDFEEAFEAGLLEQPFLRTSEGRLEHVLVLPESESQDPVPGFNPTGFFGTRGVYCFELGLRLGMLSLADFTPDGRPDSQGIGNFGLMSYGLFTGLGIVPSAPSAFNRWLMGWVDAVDVDRDARVRVAAMGSSGRAVGDTLLVRVPLSGREYWLLEYRLQDPDGDLFFSFADSNKNRFPDYWDADSVFGDGTPSSPFDPLSDAWESTRGGEWDWFMSENSARSDDRCMRAGGSGLYVWHVDERILEDNVRAGTNLINADRDHKGVDVEEADRIQDLDSPLPSEYFLGWDGDAWRGEGYSEFGPESQPATTTAQGLPTGIRIFDVSNVVADSLPRDPDGNCTGFVYRRAMEFSVEFGAPNEVGAVEKSRRIFETHPVRFDVRLHDLGAAPGDPNPDGAMEILMAADGGGLVALRGDLSPWRTGGDPNADLGILAIASEPAAPPRWLGPPALGDLDGDRSPEILLSSAHALHAFRPTGEELLDGDADPSTNGPLWRPADMQLVGAPVFDAEQRRILQAVRSDAGLSLVQLTVEPPAIDVQAGPALPGESRGGLLLVGEPFAGWALIPWGDEEGDGFLALRPPAPPTGAVWPAPLRLRLPARLGAVEPVSFDLGEPSGPSVVWVDASGRVHRSVLPLDPGAAGDEMLVDFEGVLRGEGATSPLSPGPRMMEGPLVLAGAAGDGLWVLESGLRSVSGTPYRPPISGSRLYGDSLQVAPLLVDLADDPQVEIVWHDAAGRLHVVDLVGRALPGWPIAGPAEPAGSPAVGDVDADGELELVSAGAFDRILELDVPGRDVQTRGVGELRVHDLPGAGRDRFLPWPQGRGASDNAGWQRSSPRKSVATGSVFDRDSMLIHPNPAWGDVVRVRVRLGREARVTVALYDLQGQRLLQRGPFLVAAGEHLDEPLPVDQLTPGMYVCQVRSDGESHELAFAIVR